MEQAREYALAEKSLAKKDKRQANSFGKGATSGAVALSGLHLHRLTEYLVNKWKTPTRANAPEYPLERLLRQLEPELVALVCLQTGLHVAAQNEKLQVKAFSMFAENLEAECFYAGLFRGNRKLAQRASKYAAQKHGNQRMRHAAARAVAEKAGFRQDRWHGPERTIAGVWCSNLLTEGLPDVFRWEEFKVWNKALGVPETFRTLTITEEAEAYMREAVRDLIQRRPVWLPRATPPDPWTGLKMKPSEDNRVNKNVQLIRTHNQDQLRAVKEAIADGTMAPTLKGINALQSVPFKINSWLLNVMEEVQEQGIVVPGFTVAAKVDVPEKLPPEQWEALSPEERRLATEARESAKALNRQRSGDLTLLAMDMEEARRLATQPEFYLPVSMDFRGRVYPLPSFNFQRGDHVRSLFLFKNGLPVGEKGIYWLSVHVANCWAQKGPDGVGLDKKPLDERVKWVNENLRQIHASAEDPLANHSWWTQADAPFLFLAACRELSSALDAGSQYVTHLPVSFDGSCSGLQHLAGAMRAAEGKLVNLTDTAEPLDIYSIVAEEARKIIEADARGADEKKRRYAELFLSYKNGEGIDRKLLKRNCMTFCYSSEASGMGDQQYEDLMIPLQAEAIRTKTPHHFGSIKEQAGAARYMGQVAYAAITNVVKKPAEAMDFLKALAKALAHEGKPLRWVTPAGLPCVNRYHEVTTKTLQLWLHNERINITVAVGNDPAIKKMKCQRAISPNFVHSMDAAHLLLTVGAAADEGIEMVTVHDSFGCLPAHADRCNQIIREQFVQMYQQHDVLTSCRETARADLTEANHWRLPPLPEKGTLELSEVLQAKYAFA